MRFRIAPLIAQGLILKILSLSAALLKVQDTMLLSRLLMVTFSPKFHAVFITALIALKLMRLVVRSRPTKVNSFVVVVCSSFIVKSKHSAVGGVGVLSASMKKKSEEVWWGFNTISGKQRIPDKTRRRSTLV